MYLGRLNTRDDNDSYVDASGWTDVYQPTAGKMTWETIDEINNNLDTIEDDLRKQVLRVSKGALSRNSWLNLWSGDPTEGELRVSLADSWYWSDERTELFNALQANQIYTKTDSNGVVTRGMVDILLGKNKADGVASIGSYGIDSSIEGFLDMGGWGDSGNVSS